MTKKISIQYLLAASICMYVGLIAQLYNEWIFSLITLIIAAILFFITIIKMFL
jgi:cyanate permease